MMLKFFGKEECRDEYDVKTEEVLAVFEGRFPLLLKKEMSLEMKKLDADLRSQIAELGKGKQGEKDAEVDDDEASLFDKKIFELCSTHY